VRWKSNKRLFSELFRITLSAKLEGDVTYAKAKRGCDSNDPDKLGIHREKSLSQHIDHVAGAEVAFFWPLMPRTRKIDREKIQASLDTPCPKCGFLISPELIR
jgi:hypothetical protein